MTESAATLELISWHSPNVGEEFVNSLREFGFAALCDHPLDMQRVERIYKNWRAFFASGEAADFTMDPKKQDGFFSVSQAESAKGFVQRDFKEYYQYYPWGRCPEALLADISTHYRDTVAFASELLSFVERHSPEHLRPRFSEPLSAMIKDSGQSMLRILHYPPVEPGQKVLRAAPHEDINLLTILPAADGPGLEIRRQSGDWLAVPNRPEQVLVNIGDMLQEITDGWFPSTTHQVATPTQESLTAGRMSLPLFLHPRPEVVLSEHHTAGSYLDERLRELGVVV